MVNLGELMDGELFKRMLSEGMIRQQVHPTLPLHILNYTEKATFSRTWNEVTLQCRGLIYNSETREVVARPFPKFFNYGEDQSTQSFDDYRQASVVVTDKLDGSLGIMYPSFEQHNGYAIATRGSFTSPQAIHGTTTLQRYMDDGWAPDYSGQTYLFEIIYPGNRIVCDYGTMDELVLLGTVDIEHGWSTSAPFSGFPGPRAKVFEYSSFEEALAAPPRNGAEGLVVHFPERDRRLKLKQADYVALHRVVTGLNERAVWQLMQDGRTCKEIQEPLPEEFWPWITAVYEELDSKFTKIFLRTINDFDTIVNELGPGFERKDFALKATRTDHAALLFALLDDRDIEPAIWTRIRPGYRPGPWQRGEDNA